jgi:C4-dicarboxylate-specific signal transduction histidine kinase
MLNALDALPQGGRIEVALASSPAKDDIEIRVVDSGPGIAAAILPKLFEPFVSAKETGLGMGLVVSQRIVREHGGDLCGFNLPQGGACFVARLPAPAA